MKDNTNKPAWQVTGMNAVEAAKNLANTKTGQEVPTIVKNSENSPKTTAEHII